MAELERPSREAVGPAPRRARDGSAAAALGGGAAPHARLLGLQRSAGNQAVSALVRELHRSGRGRGGNFDPNVPTPNAAPNQATIAFANLPPAAQAAVLEILAGHERDYLRPLEGRHNSDPETGRGKPLNLRVREYHVVANQTQRIVTRGPLSGRVVYYDPAHAAGAYMYHPVTGIPAAPAAANPPAANPPAANAPAPVPNAPAPAANPPAAAPAAQPEVPENWEELA